MSEEIIVLPIKFCHPVPHTKYVNFGNHCFALVSVHLFSKYKPLADTNVVIMTIWELIKKSLVGKIIISAWYSSKSNGSKYF